MERKNSTSEFDCLSKTQKKVIDFFEQRKNLFVSGGAGTGKSYLLNLLKRNYAKYGLEVTASTGIAALNVGGSTIYSWAGIGLGNMPPEQILENINSVKFSKIRQRIRKATALAIDEISMISSEIFEILNLVFQNVRQNKAPMGGIQILLFGDFLQLPPVTRNNENFNFCFNSKTWQDLDLQNVILNETFRQSDQKFVKILQNIRIGSLNKEACDALESRLNAVDYNSIIRPTILTTHNIKVEQVNHEHLKKIPYPEINFQAQYQGENNKIEFFRKNCIAYETLKLKVGAQVMMIKNSFQKEGIINGSLGVIKDFSAKKSYPIVEFSNGKIITIAPEEWVIEKFDSETKTTKIEASMIQIPLVLAWAMTIHKSQGLTLDKISCDLSDVFSPGQAYVALSRARTLDGIFIKSLNLQKIIANEEAVKFYNNLESL